MSAYNLIQYQQWIQDHLNKAFSEYAQWYNKDRADYDRVGNSLNELSEEVGDLENAINSYNQHLQNEENGVHVPSNVIEGSKRLVDKGEVRINRLIARINQELASFHSAGQTRVENMEWWIPPATIVCVAGGLLVLAASFAIAAPVAASYMMGSGLTAAVAGGGAALVCHTKAENMKERNKSDEDHLTSCLAGLESRADTVKSRKRTVQPEDDSPSTKRRT